MFVLSYVLFYCQLFANGDDFAFQLTNLQGKGGIFQRRQRVNISVRKGNSESMFVP